MQSKPFWFSKTFWVNLLLGLSPVTEQLFGFGLSAQTVAMLLPIANVLLRFVTNQPVTIS